MCLGDGGGLRFAGGASISFGDSPQDVWTQLGAPGDTFHKPSGKMLLHAGADDHEGRGSASPDYFYNYFTRGIDVLFDGETHCAKKFVLHSNQVGHPDFNVYVKCNFVVEVPVGDDDGRGGGGDRNGGDDGSAATEGTAGSRGDPAEADTDTTGPGDHLFNDSDMDDFESIPAVEGDMVDENGFGSRRLKGLIYVDSTFDDVQRLLGDGGRATIHTQFMSGSASNPFGSTLIYGYPERITFEIMKSGNIANITLF